MDFSSRREASKQALELLQRQPRFIDTETTGAGPTAEIVEICIIDYDGSILVDTLVKPKGVIEPEAAKINKITMEMLQDAPSWAQVWPQIEPLLAGRLIGTYNSDFDLRMLKQSHQRSWLKWQLPDEQFFCIMKLYARYYGDWNRQRRAYTFQSLDMAARQCGIPLPNAHRAKEDTLLARALLIYMATGKVNL